MVQLRWLVVVGLLTALHVPAVGQDKADLKWKFEKGKTTYQVMTTDAKIAMTVQGKEITNHSKQTVYMSWTPESQADKSWTFKQKILGMKMEMDFLGQKIEYDSTNPGATPKQLADTLQPLIGAEFEVTVGPDLKVTRVQGYKELLDKLGQANPQVKQMMAGTFTEDTIKNMSDQYFSIVPNKEVSKGDSWTSDARVPLGGLGTLSVKRKYTYEGRDGKLDKIKVATTSIQYEGAGANPPGGLPFKIKKGDLKGSTYTGTILFNSEQGRLESSQEDGKITGKLTFEIAGNEVDVDLTQNQKVTIKTSEKDPLKK
jgi:hypothetical protein